MRVLTHVKTKSMAVALTFDDGPDPLWTPRFLDLLKRRGARATFFVVGSKAVKHTDCLVRILREGHELAYHGWNHELGSEDILSGLKGLLKEHQRGRSAEDKVMKYWRPPYGRLGMGDWIVARLAGFQVVGWSFNILDWIIDDPNALAPYLRTRLAPGAIVLLHDCHKVDRNHLYLALDRVMEKPLFTFLTLSELLQEGKPGYDWKWMLNNPKGRFF
jgi:peptidoglycan/xylan/chitin deacetylase (PgdA/CDA1 family)